MGDRPGPALAANSDRGRRIWNFAGSVFDERTLELLVDGVDAELERKPLEVLIYLLEHAGEVCTKDELLDGVWPGRILSETVLTKCISRLREVLGDRNQDIIKTVYGFGYRLVAAARMDVASGPQPARLDFKLGDHPPGRPFWSLVERLSTGEHGETWRACHEKTHETRVFRFALDESSLGTLKREITLFRLMNDLLGERAPIVRLLDWNLEQLPYFTEAETRDGNDLIDWTKARGGAGAVPLAERLKLVAKICTALAAVHSVGVVHGNLSPSKIRVPPGPGESFDITLQDFGSGAVLDARHIDRLGITRLGFTKTVASGVPSIDSPYLAPEILSGRPRTAKSDIYAVGVMLYQFITGDFHRAMPEGWAVDIEDELLRDDIASMVEENPALRLGDAGLLARQLGTLEQRRSTLHAQRDAQSRAAAKRPDTGPLRAQRAALAVALLGLTIGLVISGTLYLKARRIQERTVAAAANSRAISEFLSDALLAQLPEGVDTEREATAAERLRRAGDDIDARFAAQPRVATQLHYVIGRSFTRIRDYAAAARHFDRALELGQPLDEATADPVLGSAANLLDLDYRRGSLRQSMPRYDALLAAAERNIAPGAVALLEFRQQMALGRYRLGDWAQAAQALEKLVDSHGTPSPTPAYIGRTELYLGQVLTDLARSADAQAHLRRAVDLLAPAGVSTRDTVAAAQASLARSLADAGQYGDAAAALDKAQALAATPAPPDQATSLLVAYIRALVFLQQDMPESAEPLLTHSIDAAAAPPGDARSAPPVDRSGAARQALGEAYGREGRFYAAIPTLQLAVAVSELADGPKHPRSLSTRLSLAECLVVEGRDADARAVLATSPLDLTALPAVHPIAAQLSRVYGLLAQHAGQVEQARRAFENSLAILQSLYGTEHWRVIRARRELQLTTS